MAAERGKNQSVPGKGSDSDRECKGCLIQNGEPGMHIYLSKINGLNRLDMQVCIYAYVFMYIHI